MPESVLVTGATGNVGHQVVQLLLKEGNYRVMAGVRNLEKAKYLEDEGAHLVEMNLNDEASVDRAVAGADRVFLLTPFDESQVLQGARVVAAAEAAKIKRIVNMAAIGTESEPGITLTRMHRSIELSVAGSQIDYVLLRPNGFMQNFERYAGSIKSGGVFYEPLGDAKVSFIDTADIAACAVRAISEPSDQFSGHAYELTGPEALSDEDVANILSDVLEKDVEFMNIPDQAAADAMRGMGMPNLLVSALIELYELYRAGGASHVTNNVELLTGRPATSFEDYARRNIAKYQ